ncbi:B-box zinc finger protein 19 isoform X3 [Panicum miliaceum]|uniref:B-box zinc finger protein 19 isoform X3 n=1 Tax=Panicum miliaceum TaxID=4540 RepID=A0A3L6T7G8_PANMI|nr:B-box zinc finger protein 19 isoform X3 [Panicum miliaceum]
MRTICDVCESAPAVLFCAADEAALCRACDEKFPGDKLGHMDDDVAMQSKDTENQIDQKKPPHSATKEQMANHHNGSDDPASDGNCDDQGNINSKMIDLNMRPVRTNGQGSNSQTQGVDLSVNNHDSPGVVPTSNYKGDANK